MKILFTSVGRRVELMQAFHNAAERLGVDLTIIGADIMKSAPALQFCDKAEIVCRISDVNYIPMLLSICTQDEVMIAEMKTLIADYKPCGQITVQLIQDEQTGDNYYIEINPRFGGGAPLSIKAGADSAEAVIRMLCGETLTFT